MNKASLLQAFVDFADFGKQLNTLCGREAIRHGEMFHLKAQLLVPLEQVDSDIEIIVM
jgi:hypothetical protein